MENAKVTTTLEIETNGFRGVKFEVVEVNGKVVKKNGKVINLISAMNLLNFLKNHLKNTSSAAETLSYYADYGDKIEEMLDEDEKRFEKGDDKKTKYTMDGDYAFFLEAKHDTGRGVVYADNNEAAKIIKKQFKKAYPDNKLIFDPEMSNCCVHAGTRAEAKRFMVWMNETYFQPWVKENMDGWDDFMAAYNEATKEEQSAFMFLAHNR